MPLSHARSGRAALVALFAAILSVLALASVASADDVTNPPPIIAADQNAPDALPAIGPGESLTALAVPADCALGDSSCEYLVKENVGGVVALTGDAATEAEAEAEALVSAPAPAIGAMRVKHSRFIVLKRTRTHHKARRRSGRAHTAGYVGVHYTDAKGWVCALSCSIWHATATERFYWDGTKAWAGPNSWISCVDHGGIGYSVDVNRCSFGSPNPAYYGAGSYLPGFQDVTVNFLSSIGGQAYHYVHFHNYGDGYVGVHTG